jgi:nucleotide-binding universal stress UspA family protein
MIMGSFQKILVTTDFSQGAQEGLKTARLLAADLGAEVLLLHVVEELMLPLAHTSPAKRQEFQEQAEKEAGSQLQASAQRDFKGLPVRPLLRSGVSHRQILETAENEGVDLIVMASQGRGAVSQAVFGSTTQRVLHEAVCPVVVVRRSQS